MSHTFVSKQFLLSFIHNSKKSSDHVSHLVVKAVAYRLHKSHMMPAFTSGPDAAIPPDNGLDPYITVPSQSNENIDPDDDHTYTLRTPLQSLTKASVPTTPQPNNKSTPLRRRFLQEVTMSPATPPQSPSPTKTRTSPQNESNSPIKGRGSPAKQLGKLEIGVNGFFYTCELPESKITPKKVEKDSDTPWRRTPSPTKMGSARADADSRDASPVKEIPSKRTSPAKPTPAKAPQGSPLKKLETPTKTNVRDFGIHRSSATKHGLPRKSAPAPSGTPLRKATTPKPEKHVNSAKTSPTKAIKLASKFAQGALSTSASTLGHRNEVRQDQSKEGAKKDIKDSPDTQTTKSSPRSLPKVTEKTPTKPKLGSSFDIGDMMVGIKDVLSKPCGTVVEGVGETDISEPPTPLRKAAEKLPSIVRITELNSKPFSLAEQARMESSPAKPAESVTDICIVSPFEIKEQSLQYRYLPVPVSPTHSEPSLEVGRSSPIKKHVSFKDGRGIPVRSPSRPAFPKTLRRAATDPIVHRVPTDPQFRRAILKRMNKLEQSLSLSLGVDVKLSRGKENTFELPVMASSVKEPDFGTPLPVRPKRKLLRTTSDVSNISSSTTASSVRASMIMNPEFSPTKLPIPLAKAPKWPYGGKTPAQARRERLAAAKKETDTTPRQKKGSQTSAPSKVPPLKPVSTPRCSKTPDAGATPRSSANSPSTPIRSAATSRLVSTRSTPRRTGLVAGTPSRARDIPRAVPTRAKPTTTSKSAVGGIPQSARKSVFDCPTQPTSTSTSKYHTKSPGSTVARKPAQPSSASNATPPPKFVGAVDIANRIAEWNSEDRNKAAVDMPQESNLTEASTSRTQGSRETTTPKGSPSKPKLDMRSHTPKGSPTKLPLRSPTKSKTSRLAPPKTKSTTLTPKRAAPATPKMHNKALDRLRGEAPRTPVSVALDPNAYRTPSKEIESSLDQAIDAKIEEDAKSGKEFTPSGNRVKSLLEARAKGRK